jgi:hypothetical protein
MFSQKTNDVCNSENTGGALMKALFGRKFTDIKELREATEDAKFEMEGYIVQSRRKFFKYFLMVGFRFTPKWTIFIIEKN